MSNQREALKIALEVLDSKHNFNSAEWRVLHYRAFQTIREALAETEQYPVAWMYHGILHNGTPHDRPSLIWRPEYMDAMSANMGAKATPLYTAPPQRKPLTDEQLRKLARDAGIKLMNDETLALGYMPATIKKFACAIERAHGIGDE
jgi:hypothetical protein